MDQDLKDAEKNAIDDYNKAREYIIRAEDRVGKSKIVGKMIADVAKKLDISLRCRLKFKEDNSDVDSLADATNSALQARLLSTDAWEKAEAVDLKMGLFYVKFNIAIVVGISVAYALLHWYLDIPWFKMDFWWEVIFFSLFGVLTNLTYSAALHVLNRDFDKWHQGWYLAKIFQAPFLALAIILVLKSINVDVLDTSIDIRTAPDEIIVALAYIIGLFSRRAWEFIERIKDWLLPLNSNKNS